jgi:hypothetical protein
VASVATAKADDFDKNKIIMGRKFEEMLKILDKIEDPPYFKGLLSCLIFSTFLQISFPQ